MSRLCDPCLDAERDAVDEATKQALLRKLRAYAAIPRTRFDPPGCKYCGDTSGFAAGSLCRTCTDRLQRLSHVAGTYDDNGDEGGDP